MIATGERSARGQARWVCRCDCGAEKEFFAGNVKTGKSTSCGCYRAEYHSERLTTHGMTRTRTYRVWASMLTRCGNPNGFEYHRYGARGIEVCRRWRESFLAFVQDMGEVPAGKSIDRIDNDGHYQPGNCRWATAREQALNRRPRQHYQGRPIKGRNQK